MKVTYSESPSFEPGWAVYVDFRNKLIQVRPLRRDAYVRVGMHAELFPVRLPSCELRPEDEAQLSGLIDQIRFVARPNGGITLDGTLQALSLIGGTGGVAVEWNGGSSPGGDKTEELLEILRALAQPLLGRCDSLEVDPPTPLGPNWLPQSP
jgi:hypothetical protein